MLLLRSDDGNKLNTSEIMGNILKLNGATALYSIRLLDTVKVKNIHILRLQCLTAFFVAPNDYIIELN